MTPQPQPKTTTRLKRATLFLAVGGTLFFLAMPGTAKPGDPAGDDAEIDVTFHADDMGFNVTSTKGISNVEVQVCGPLVEDENPHKHEFSDEILYFNHTEDLEVVGVWVKSGNNGVGGRGEFFANEGVDCSEGTSTETQTDTGTETGTGSETDTETSGSETETETSGSETDTETSGSETDSETSGSDTQTETEEIPVFGTATTLALGIGGALGGALLMLRRKL